MGMGMYKSIGGKTYRMLAGNFWRRKDAEDFVKSSELGKNFYYRITKGSDGRWYVYGIPKARKKRKRR